MNKKSAISKKPTQQDVDNFINKGIQDEDKTTTSSQSKKEIARVQLRIEKEKLDQIDNAVNQRKVKISRHLWFLEAIEEKLEREMSE